MARRADHSHDEIRAMAVDAAARMIADDGLENLKLRGIAREIGYAPGTLYNVFDSFDELMMRVNAETVDALVAELEAAEHDGAPPDLLDLLAVYGGFAQRHGNRWKAVFDYSLADPTNAPDWYVAKLNAGLAVVERAVARIAGDNPAEAPAETARVLWAGLHGIFSLGAEGNLAIVSRQDTDTLARTFVRMIDRAIRA
ncbi:MAG: TetR/AcrR family transcriptional regulator [Minwuia sp.]|uniref:TetR/AcrR family transcriptional regulator n=1 Tax=Minwuia sp. TaxID=2493630 RepID=UPI003A841839